MTQNIEIYYKVVDEKVALYVTFLDGTGLLTTKLVRVYHSNEELPIILVGETKFSECSERMLHVKPRLIFPFSRTKPDSSNDQETEK